MARPPIGRQQLLDAARTVLVAGNGMLELSALTRKSGLSTGAVYHHFGSKSGLLATIYDAFYEGLSEAISDVHLPPGEKWGPRERERTRRFVAYHFDDPLAPILLNRTALDPELTELEAVHLQRITDDAAFNIRRGQGSGQLPGDIDPDSAAAFVIGGLRHGVAQQLRITPRPTVELATTRLWSATSGALGIP